MPSTETASRKKLSLCLFSELSDRFALFLNKSVKSCRRTGQEVKCCAAGQTHGTVELGEFGLQHVELQVPPVHGPALRLVTHCGQNHRRREDHGRPAHGPG
ncbi:hypothetical protein EYF80_045028 [Liparis tanakae]|uniref:Uncharacterized protein n=1 Tax=Liparis tanakae TaxID=230148 RepID=A0A4Z2FUF6_9TELE|nr:hypothetical protein EYF80_045028 [Liparis tanakae]